MKKAFRSLFSNRAFIVWIPVIFLLLFIGSRLLCLLTAVQAVSYYPEELDRGNIGRALLEVRNIPFWRYQLFLSDGGHLLVSILAAGSFKLLGQSLFALKLVPLICFFAPAGLLMYLFLKKFFSLRAAILSALIFIFPGLTMTQMSLVAMGFHSESILFSMGILYFYFAWRNSRSANVFYLAVFGVICGLGVWFMPTVGLSVAACFLSDVFDQRRMFRAKNLMIVTGSFFLGLLPLIIPNIFRNFEGFQYLLNGFMTKTRYQEGFASFAADFMARFYNLIFSAAPQSYGFQRQLGSAGELLSYFYFLLAGIAWGGLFWDFIRNKNKWLMPIVFYAPIFAAAVCTSTFTIGDQVHLSHSRYLVPLHFYLIMVIGIFCAQDGWFKKAIYGLLLSMGIIGFSGLIFKSDFGQALQYKGYYPDMTASPEWQRLQPLLELPGPKDIPLEPEPWMNRLPSRMRCYTLSRIGAKAVSRLDTAEVDILLQDTAISDQACFYSGFTEYFFDLPSSLNNFGQMSAKSHDFFYRRLAWFLFKDKAGFDRDFAKERIKTFTEREAEQFYRGLGELVILDYWNSDMGSMSPLRNFFGFEIPENNVKEFYWGVGWGLGADLNCDRLRLMGWIDLLPQRERAWAMTGFRAVDEFYHISENCQGV